MRARDVKGFSFGVNTGLHTGFELAGDWFEFKFNAPGHGNVGEWGVLTLAPEFRYRYPLLDNRLVPYALAGVGVARGQFNDRKPRGDGLEIEKTATWPIGEVGAGIEYYVANNVAMGLEAKYIAAGRQSIEVNGQPTKQDFSTFLLQASLRVLYPETDPLAPLEAPNKFTRLYVGVRVGGAVLTNDRIFSGTGTTPQASALFDSVEQMYGLALGANFGKYLGTELSFEGFGTNLTLAGGTAIGEYSVYLITPQLRLRYPLIDKTLEPYIIAGVGAALGEFNDAKPPANTLKVSAVDWSYGVTAGTGIDYFLMRNLAVGAETKFITTPGHSLQINHGPTQKGTVNALMFSFGIRVFLWDL